MMTRMKSVSVMMTKNYKVRPFLTEGFFISWIFMIMRYIITESRLQDIFDKYMESTYDLRYYSEAREFRVKVRWGNIFGDLWEQRFFYAYQSEEDLLKSIFGEDNNKL